MPQFQQPPKLSIKLQDVVGLNEPVDKDGSKRIEVDVVDGTKPIVLKCNHHSDHAIWYEMLQEAIKAVKSGSLPARHPSARQSRMSLSEGVSGSRFLSRRCWAVTTALPPTSPL